MRLIDVYLEAEAAVMPLYKLLESRDPAVSISHKAMPSLAEHVAFIASRPYAAWYLIRAQRFADRSPDIAGAVYLTKPASLGHPGDEIGIQLFPEWQGRGLGPEAIRQVMAVHPRPAFFAHINPANHRSVNMFMGLGFKLRQVTYALGEE